ncbi:E3 ubiquitin-protein ligase [Sesbania bispinosa]|nr:E3 ubiquitin-protein ligase [Sesbania bispinosa]
MAIEAHLHPSNIGFPLCVPQDLASFNSQQQHFTSLKHQQHPEQCLQQLYTSIADPNPLFHSNLNAYNYNTTNKYHHNQPSKSLAIQFAQQRDEVDQYIISQNEKLRIMLQEKRKQQVFSLLKKVESDAIYMLNQKDEQIAQAVKKKAELEEFLRRLEAENQSWRRVAQENEAIVLSLHNTLEQIKEKNSAIEDSESCYHENRAMEEGTGENRVCSGTFVPAKLVRVFSKHVLYAACQRSLV